MTPPTRTRPIAPDLVPETSRNVEAGAYWTGSLDGTAIEARAIGYYNRVSELIVFGWDYQLDPGGVTGTGDPGEQGV